NRVGGGKVTVDVRVIASTSRELPLEIAAGRFREDLYYRLAVVPIAVPPLVERREDIPLLANYLMLRAAAAARIAPRAFGDDALAAMQAYEWPGNVRQLRNVIEWLLIMAPAEAHQPIRADMLPAEIGGARRPQRRNDEPAAARGARNVRAGLPARAGRPLRRQHLAHCRVHRHGTLGPASQAQIAGPGRGESAG